jgi:hypothetical protein
MRGYRGRSGYCAPATKSLIKKETLRPSWAACMLSIQMIFNLEADSCSTDISAQKHAEENAVARANLVEKLALRTQEAAQHERNFQQMAELAPCGMSMPQIQ